jgi:hypothetical protein
VVKVSKLIIEDRPIMFSPKLAKVVGVSKAIILQQIHYWAKEINEKANKESVYREGHYWTRRTIKEWHEGELDFISERQLKRLFKSMEEEELIIVDSFNSKRYDKTNWYRVNYEKLEKIEFEEKNKTLVTECHQGDKVAPSKGQNGTMDSDKMSLTMGIDKEEIKKESSSREKEKSAAASVWNFEKDLKELLNQEKITYNKNTVTNISKNSEKNLETVKEAVSYMKKSTKEMTPGVLVAILRDKDYTNTEKPLKGPQNRNEKVEFMKKYLGESEIQKLKELINKNLGLIPGADLYLDQELGNVLCQRYNKLSKNEKIRDLGH